MADVYVRSGAAGAADGSDWANAYTTLSAALTAGSAGDTFWVADDHAESTAGAVTLTSPGTIAAPCFIYCVSDAGSVPPVAADLVTTGSVATTGANSITFVGYAYCRGLTFSAASGSSNGSISSASAANMRWTLEACKLILNTTSASANITIGGTGAANYALHLINTTAKFGAVDQGFSCTAGYFSWKNTATALDAAGSIPTNLFKASTRTFNAELEGVDLVQVVTGKTVVAATTAAGRFMLKDCKLGAGATIAATPTGSAMRIIALRCSDTAGNFIEQLYTYEGTQTDETTIVRTGGSSDGATPKSRKIVTTANAKPVAPFEVLPIAVWVEAGNATITMHGIWGGGSVPNNDEVWMDVEYLDDASSPQGSFATSGRANLLASATALSADSSTWGGSTTDFATSVTISPAQDGYIYVYPKIGKASETVYLDGKLTVS